MNQENQNNLKDFVAQQLSCEELQLKREEMSLRLLDVFSPEGMMAPLECDISAANFPKRVEKQDEICINVRGALLKIFEGIGDAKVRLQLCELGHSIEEPEQNFVTIDDPEEDNNLEKEK